MSIPGSANPLLLASAAGGYNISRSIRLNAPDSAYLSRTPASAGNRKTWTWAGWVKRSALGSIQALMTVEGNSDSTTAQFWFSSDDKFRFGIETADIFITNAVFRDCSAWYHIVFAFDATNATSADKMILYVNGVRQTTSTYTAPSNTDYGFNRASAIHSIGRRQNNADWYLNGYLADVYLIDGQQLTPSAFGEFSATTGVWVPKAYSGGSYGTNGFRLDFSNNASTTTIGEDAAGSNDWTANNISVTAGVGNDSLVDSPTNYGTDTGAGGEVRGNYCTWNPLANTSGTLTNGNLDLQAVSGNADTRTNATIAVSSGKWYYEITLESAATNSSAGFGQNNITNAWPGNDARSYAYELDNARTANNGTLTAYGSALTSGDVFMCALDLDNNKIFFGKNGTWFNSSNPSTGASPAFTVSAGTYSPIGRPYGNLSAKFNANFGQRPFAYPLSGFKALCTANLPAPTIEKPSTAFDVALYTGNGSTQTISGLGFSPDLVWLKKRGGDAALRAHQLFDVVRGANKSLYSNLTDAEFTDTDALTSFNSNGFSLGAEAGINTLNDSLVAWCWDAGNTTVTNTQGSITSQVRANVSAGFSIVSWTGNATNGATVGHGLGVKPHLVIYKNRTDVESWPVLSDVLLGPTGYLYLDSTAAKSDAAQVAAPTSTVLTLSSYNDANGNSDAMIAYCFAPVVGYSSFGSFSGGSNPNFVYLGFRPRYVIIKRTDTTNYWIIQDSARNPYNQVDLKLAANASVAENDVSTLGDATQNQLDFVSNGFVCRSTNAGTNTSGGTYIYVAFAESPFAANNRAR